MKGAGIISQATFDHIIAVGSVIPRLYVLPKVNMPDRSLSPILEMRESPYHSTARWLAEWVEPMDQRIYKCSFRDEFALEDAIRDLKVNEKHMICLDVYLLLELSCTFVSSFRNIIFQYRLRGKISLADSWRKEIHRQRHSRLLSRHRP